MLRGDKVGLQPVRKSDLALLSAWTNDLDHNSESNTFGFRPDRLEEEFAKTGFLDHRGGALLVAEGASEEGGGFGDLSPGRLWT